MRSDLGADCPVFNWSGKNYQIVPGTANFNKTLREGGFSFMFDLSLTTTVQQFLDVKGVPDAIALQGKMLKTRINYLGVDYKIENVSVAAGGTQITIHANSVNQGA